MGQLEDIIDELVKSKDTYLIEEYKKLKKKKIKEVNLLEKYKQEQSEQKLKTGTLIDILIGGGLDAGSSMLLYGQYGSGKTQTCFTMAVLCPDHVIPKFIYLSRKHG